MRTCLRPLGLAALLSALLAPWSVGASGGGSTASSSSLEQFLERDVKPSHYRAVRRLEAENRGRFAWMEAATDYSAADGFRFHITGEGGSSYIRGKVLRPLLEGEAAMFARGETGRSALTPSNYDFEASGVDADGLANIQLSPRRKDGVLVVGTLFVRPFDGELVRLQGRLAKSPSFWVKHVDIVRSYARVNGFVLPIALESNAELRIFGPATLRMTYAYSEINGRPIDGAYARAAL